MRHPFVFDPINVKIMYKRDFCKEFVFLMYSDVNERQITFCGFIPKYLFHAVLTC